MKIKLLDFTITADVSEAEEQEFKKCLREKNDISESKMLDSIELLDYMLYSCDYDKDRMTLIIYNPQTIKEKLSNSKIYHSFDIDIKNDGGVSIESWRLYE